MNFDTNIEKYISESQDFAKPILNHLRQLIHDTIPEVEEKIKWGMPAFEYKGPICHFAAFKNHCVFGIWKAKLLKDPHGYLGKRFNNGGEAMGHFGRIRDIKDLPPDSAIIKLLLEAKELNDKGIKLPTVPKKVIETKEVPSYFLERMNAETLFNFNKLSPSCKREYTDWITEAKTEVTRNKRIEAALDLISVGKSRHAKYKK